LYFQSRYKSISQESVVFVGWLSRQKSVEIPTSGRDVWNVAPLLGREHVPPLRVDEAECVRPNALLPRGFERLSPRLDVGRERLWRPNPIVPDQRRTCAFDDMCMSVGE
jgi:hypothetical protein